MFDRARMIIAAAPLLLGLISMNGCAGPRPIETIRASGVQKFNTGNYAMARDEYAEIVARFPGDWEAQYMLGVTLIKTEEYAKARQALETAYTQKPDDPEVAAALAEAMFLQGDDDKLYAFLRDRATTSRAPEAYLLMGDYALKLQDPDSARIAFDTAIEVDNARTTVPYLRAATLAERLGHLEIAVHRLRQALGINPYDTRVAVKLRELGEDPAKITPLPPGRELPSTANVNVTPR